MSGEEYKIMKIKDGQIIEIAYSVLEAEIRAKAMNALDTDMLRLESLFKEIRNDHFGVEKLAPTITLADVVRQKMLSKSSFLVSEIVGELTNEYRGAYSESSIKQTPYAIVKELEKAEKLRQLPDKKYLNLAFEEKQEIIDDLKASKVHLDGV